MDVRYRLKQTRRRSLQSVPRDKLLSSKHHLTDPIGRQTAPITTRASLISEDPSERFPRFGARGVGSDAFSDRRRLLTRDRNGSNGCRASGLEPVRVRQNIDRMLCPSEMENFDAHRSGGRGPDDDRTRKVSLCPMLCCVGLCSADHTALMGDSATKVTSAFHKSRRVTPSAAKKSSTKIGRELG